MSVEPPPSASGAASPAASESAPASEAAVPTASPPSASGSTGLVDACALLTPSEVAGIIGGPEPVGQPLPGGGWVASQCAWSSPVASFLLSVGTPASIQAFDDPTAPDAKARLADFKRRDSGSEAAKDVAGIGDGAVLGTAGIAAYSGGTYLEILRLTLTDDQLTEIAKLALAKL